MTKCACILLVYDPINQSNSKKNVSELIEKLISVSEVSEIVLVCNDIQKNNNLFLESLDQDILENLKIKILKLNHNVGASKGFNLGFEELSEKTDVVCFTSLDLYLLDNKIFTLATNYFRNNKNIGILHPKSCFEDNDYFNFSKDCSSAKFIKLKKNIQTLDDAKKVEKKIFNSAQLYNKNLNDRVTISNASRCPLTLCFFSYQALKKISAFDENFVSGGENIDIAIRMRNKNFKVVRLNYCVGHSRISFRLLGQGGGNKTGTINEISIKAKDYIFQKYKNWNIVYFKQVYGKQWFIFLYIKKIEKIIRFFLGIWPYRNW